MRLAKGMLLVSLVVLGAIAVSVASAGDGPGEKGKRDMRQLAGVNFISNCAFSHRAQDDPIVSFGRRGASHDHSFVGNTSTNAFSTLQSLRRAGTSCRRTGDTAAYWTPTLFANGKPVEPAGSTIYYRRRTLDEVRAFPPGLKMIQGARPREARRTAA